MWPIGLLCLYIFHFSIYFHFSEVKLSQTIYWNHFLLYPPWIKIRGIYRNHCLSICLSVSLSVCPSVCTDLCSAHKIFCGIEQSSKCHRSASCHRTALKFLPNCRCQTVDASTETHASCNGVWISVLTFV